MRIAKPVAMATMAGGTYFEATAKPETITPSRVIVPAIKVATPAAIGLTGYKYGDIPQGKDLPYRHELEDSPAYVHNVNKALNDEGIPVSKLAANTIWAHYVFHPAWGSGQDIAFERKTAEAFYKEYDEGSAELKEMVDGGASDEDVAKKREEVCYSLVGYIAHVSFKSIKIIHDNLMHNSFDKEDIRARQEEKDETAQAMEERLAYHLEHDIPMSPGLKEELQESLALGTDEDKALLEIMDHAFERIQQEREEQNYVQVMDGLKSSVQSQPDVEDSIAKTKHFKEQLEQVKSEGAEQDIEHDGPDDDYDSPALS